MKRYPEVTSNTIFLFLLSRCYDRNPPKIPGIKHKIAWSEVFSNKLKVP